MSDSLIKPTRRTLVRGAAWSVPVVSMATAAPAFAASPCATAYAYFLNWGSTTYSHPNVTPSVGTATIASSNGGPTIYAVFSTVFSGSGAGDGTLPSGEARNLSVPTATAGGDATRDPAITNLGGLGADEKGLRLQETSPAGSTNRQTLTVSFRTGSATGPLVNVRGLSFSIVDIDAITTFPYSDRVVLSPTVPVTSQAKDTNIRGNGQDVAETDNNVGPWRSSQTNTNVGENTAGARVAISYPNTVADQFTSFNLAYWTNTGTGQYHRIFLSDFNFKSTGC